MYYFTLPQAIEELDRRRGQKNFIEEWWKNKNWILPNLPPSQDLAIFARQVATCRYEDLLFFRLAKSYELNPFWMEYHRDSFSTASSFKRSLAHPMFFYGRGRNKGEKIKKDKLNNMRSYDGQPLQSIPAKGSLTLIDYHHQLQDQFIANDNGKVLRSDFSDWLSSFGSSKKYYFPYLSLFVAHAILFEDFHGGESGNRLDRFIQFVFEPAWKKLVDELGFDLKPLIVKMPPWQTQMAYYPTTEFIDFDIIQRWIKPLLQGK